MRKSSGKLRIRFIKQLSALDLTVAFAESVTCGLAMHQLSKVKGTLEVLRGGIVCYHENVKKEVLKVPPKLLMKHTAESREVTSRLALSLQSFIEADIHAAITGLAAPGGSETKQKPVGTVFISVVFRNRTFHHRKLFRGTPQEIMQKACDALYRYILEVVAKK